MAAQKGVQSRPPEARALDRTQRSIQHTHNPEGEQHAMRLFSMYMYTCTKSRARTDTVVRTLRERERDKEVRHYREKR